MAYQEIDEIIKSTSYTSLLFGTYKESPVWSTFFSVVDEVFTGLFKSKLSQLVNVRVPDKVSREINILNASNFGFNIKNSFFTNDEYINLIENLKLYERKKGTKYFMDILGLIKSAHFNVYQLWTSDYKVFERDSVWVQNQSILKDYKRTFDVTLTTIDDGSILDTVTEWADDGTTYGVVSEYVDEGIITAESLKTELPDINDPDYYVGKYYPTSHVDLEYDVTLFPISEDDIRYLFYKLAPIHLVLNLIDGTTYTDTVNLYIAVGPGLERSWDTFAIWANYEAYLYLNALFYEVEEYTGGRLYYNYTNEFTPDKLEVLEYYDKAYNLNINSNIIDGSTLPSFTCSRTTNAWVLDYTSGNYLQLKEFGINIIRHVTNEGLLLENSSINWITNSDKPGNHSSSLEAGVWTLSSVGDLFNNSKVHIYSSQRDEYIDAGKSFTFTSTGEVLNIDTEEDCLNVQLEKGYASTSPIITSTIKSRAIDLYYTTNNVANSKYYMRFFKHIDDKIATSHVLSMGSGFVDTVTLNCNYNSTDGYTLEVSTMYNQVKSILLTIPFSLQEFGVILTPTTITIQLDGKEYTTNFTINLAQQLRLGADWLQQTGFNGYLTHLIRANLLS